MIYIFSKSGECLCVMHKHYEKIDEIKSELDEQLRQHNTDIFIEHDSHFDRKKIYFKDGKIEQIPDNPGDFYSYNYSTNQWEEEQQTIYTLAKNNRNLLLSQSDFTQFPDYQARLTDAEKQAWIVYRQSLRDFPSDYESFKNYVWPEKPIKGK